MSMVRAILLHAAILGHLCTASRRSLSTLSPSALAFVSCRQASGFGVGTRDDRHAFAFSGRKDFVTQARSLVLLAGSSTDHLDEKVEGQSITYLYDGNDDDFVYDNDAGDEEDLTIGNQDEDSDVDESLDTEDAPSRSFLLHKALLQSVQSSLDNLNKKTASLQRELEKAQSLEETMSRANLIVSNLYRLPPGTAAIEVEDWENDGKLVNLVLNTKKYSSAQEESDALFALARKVKRGSKVVEELLNASLDSEEILRDALLDLSGSESPQEDTFDAIVQERELDEGALILIQERLERTSKKTGFKSPNMDDLLNSNNSQVKGQQSGKKEKSQSATRYNPNPRELISPSGHKVLVGRNRRDNEAICFQLSRPTDIWMHSRGCPGAHVLLCVRRGSPEVTDDDLNFAANLAIFYSDARTERKAAVTTAEPKHITKPRGAPPGAVSLRQEGKTLMGRPDLVSDDLKEARMESGGAWDEMGYRKLGTRAKNKKRTAAVEKATREKKRQEANAKNKRKIRKEENDWF